MNNAPIRNSQTARGRSTDVNRTCTAHGGIRAIHSDDARTNDIANPDRAATRNVTTIGNCQSAIAAQGHLQTAVTNPSRVRARDRYTSTAPSAVANYCRGVGDIAAVGNRQIADARLANRERVIGRQIGIHAIDNNTAIAAGTLAQRDSAIDNNLATIGHIQSTLPAYTHIERSCGGPNRIRPRHVDGAITTALLAEIRAQAGQITPVCDGHSTIAEVAHG